MHGIADAHQEAGERPVRIMQGELARLAIRQLDEARQQRTGRQHVTHVPDPPGLLRPASPSARSTRPVRIMYQKMRMPGSAASVVNT